MATHGDPLAEVQVHPSTVSTETEPSPPEGGKVCAADPRRNWHGAAACEISARRLLMTSEPRRTAGAGLLITWKLMVPSPWPDAPEVIVSHCDSLVADQRHSRAALMPMLPVPPSAGMVEELLPMAIWQRSVPGCRTEDDEDPHPQMTVAAATAAAIPHPFAVDVFLSTHLRCASAAQRYQAHA
jgi:hypothetical protein